MPPSHRDCLRPRGPITRLFGRSGARKQDAIESEASSSEPVVPDRVYEIKLFVNEQSESGPEKPISGCFARAATTSVSSGDPISWSQFGPEKGWATPGFFTSATTCTTPFNGLYLIQGSVSGAPPPGGASLGLCVNGVSNLTIPQVAAAVNAIWSWSVTLRLNEGDVVEIVNNGMGALTVVIGDPSSPTSWWCLSALT